MTWLVQSRSLRHTLRATTGYQRLIHIATNQAPPLPFIIGGALLLAGQASGAYWMVPGAMLAILASAIDAWVLLVEIQR